MFKAHIQYEDMQCHISQRRQEGCGESQVFFISQGAFYVLQQVFQAAKSPPALIPPVTV